jgi:hypothetical protein
LFYYNKDCSDTTKVVGKQQKLSESFVVLEQRGCSQTTCLLAYSTVIPNNVVSEQLFLTV